MQDHVADALKQLDELIGFFENIKAHSKYKESDYSDIGTDDASGFITAGMEAIHRIAGENSQYAIQLGEVIKKLQPFHINHAIPQVGGALKTLRQSVAAGYLISIQELLHSNLFSDFLEMAEHLLNERYKDPAAVLIGGVLEEHLRKLCDKNSIDLEYIDSKGTLHPKKAEVMNMDLANKGTYTKLDQKNVTAWLDLRNKAAHGVFSEYTEHQVELLLQSVRDFITRLPA
jgi:hypothetical protein